MTTLTLLFNEKKLRDYELVSGRQLTIGRSPDNDIVIDNPAVSGHHARIESVASSFLIRDLDSTNGVFINQQRIEAHVLHHDDVVLIGKHKLVFNVLDRLDASGDGVTKEKDKPADDGFFEDKTRFLDTREHRDLIQRAKGTTSVGSSGPTTQNKADEKTGFLAGLWKRISRIFT